MNTTFNKKQKIFSLNIRNKIFIGFIFIAIILVGTTVFVNNKIKSATIFSAEIATTDFPTIDSFLDLNGQIYQSQAALANYIITHDEKFKAEYTRTWKNIHDTKDQITHFSKAWETSSFRTDWKLAETILMDIETIGSDIMSHFTSMTPNELSNKLSNELRPKINRIFDILDGPLKADGTREGGMYDKSYDLWENMALKSSANLNAVNQIQHILLGLYVILAIIIAYITSRTIVTPLSSAIDIAKQIATGERNLTVVSTSNDETGELLLSLAIMLQSIKQNELKLQENEIRTRTLFDNIVKTANLFSQHTSKVSKGDLTQRIPNETTHEMQQLGNDLNKMTDNLSTITHRITEACHNMVSTLEEVKQSVVVQSAGASEQASSINEITASLEEIEKSSTQTIEKAKALGNVAERTREKGQMGLQAVEQSSAGMQSIREKVQIIAKTILELSTQTQQVGEITHVVNTLAQQSKMLALNASIEAAKAGEAGKGFAVVATEVKNLAEQSEQSTTQVQKILEDIRHATEKAVMATEEGIKGVDHGTALVEQTGEIVRNLSDVIHETTIASEQIAAAIRQEGIGIEQITAGMNEINQVTGSFVSSVKQTTLAMEDLSTIAKNLKQHIDIYKI